MNTTEWKHVPGRVWLAPEEPTIEVIDAPIFARLYDEHFPLRWIIGTADGSPS